VRYREDETQPATECAARPQDSQRIATRIGARSKSQVDAEALLLMERGIIQSRTHIEQMVINMAKLFGLAFPEIPIDHEAVNATPFISRMRLLGLVLHDHGGAAAHDPPERMWVSDTVRGWCAMSAGHAARDVASALCTLRRYAQDPHFAVREWAWLAIRNHVARDPANAIESLIEWTTSEDHLLRRFAVEATRPKSVWGQHILELKKNPEMVDGFLKPLVCDSSTYVQDSVANWVNDAVGSRPDWVRGTASAWTKECNCAATRRIARRASRGL
jgi:3-methyladenine DNA glycosylase AlkC